MLDYNFIVKYVCGMSSLASHIDTTVLADGTYELIPESEGADQEAQLNAAKLTEDPGQSLEEPKAELASDYLLTLLRAPIYVPQVHGSW